MYILFYQHLIIYLIVSINVIKSYDTTMTTAIPVRGRLARALYARMLEDNNERQCNHDYWYAVNKKCLPEEVCDLFVQLDEDEESKEFLANCYDKADWIFTQVYYGLASAVLKWFITQTSINGLLRRGSMFVYSQKQFETLLDIDVNWRGQTLLDLGAGDGEVTAKMAGHFNETDVTELSTPMTWRLKEKGYKIVGLDEWCNGSKQYDVISCLNVLDRCEKPQTLLQNIKNSLVPGTGKAIIAIVLPYSPYVEYNYKDHLPSEVIPIEGRKFEDQVTSLIKKFFQPNGFKVETFTRVPYLCEGDLNHSFFVLNDAVFVLSVV